ncbi:PPS1 Dual specificity protein phosphatase PPS1 [Candida maltosa Xu316]
MFINSDTSSEFTPDLLNTVNPNQILHKKNHKWEFSINNGDDDESGVSNCRNFGDQIKLMAPLSHFVVYNYSFTNNHEITSILNQVVDTHFGNFIYSVEINENWWEYIDASYFDNDDDESLIYNNPVISEILSSSDVHSEPYASQGEHFVSRYHRYEQNLIWKMNSKKWILNNKICIGNILDYNELVSTPHDKSNDFKLIIYCDDNIEDGFCQFPTLDSLQWIWHDYMSGNNLNNIYCFKMPQLGGRSNIINSDELIILLNILKLVEKISRVNKIFIGSHDGFTGSSVLLVLIMQLLDKKIISESILSLAKANVKMFFFNHDIRLLNELEIFVDYLNKHLIQEFPTIILPDSVDLDAIDRFYYINPIIKPQLYDWFENFSSCSSSINLPSRILDHLYLGNLNHASSSTILETLQIDKVISIDELPSWWKPLNKTIQFDFELPTTQSTIIKPIYRYNNTKIYEVQFSKYHLTKPIPSGLKSLIYIHNFKDDGIDSILPLLLDSPPSIQEKLLLNPNYPIDTSTTTLIHCKIGVSRSVSLILAILMKQKRISLIQSYLLVRILRFNLIIQPNLKIFYELYMFEKYLGLDESGSFQNGKKIKKWNWEFICGEIHKLNQIYSSG